MKRRRNPQEHYTEFESKVVRTVRAFLKQEGFSSGNLNRNTLLIDLVRGDWHSKLRLQHHVENAFKIDFRDDEEKPRRFCIQGMPTTADMLRAVSDAVNSEAQKEMNI